MSNEELAKAWAETHSNDLRDETVFALHKVYFDFETLTAEDKQRVLNVMRITHEALSTLNYE